MPVELSPSKKRPLEELSVSSEANKMGRGVSSLRSVLRFAKLSPQAYSPTKGSSRAAGFDLRSAHDYLIPPRGKQVGYRPTITYNWFGRHWSSCVMIH